MKEQLQNHIEKQRNHRQRPMSCHPAFTTSPVNHFKGLSPPDQLTSKTNKNDQHHNRYR